MDKERQEKIDRENRILLRKILEQHHGIRRHSSIPPSSGIHTKLEKYYNVVCGLITFFIPDKGYYPSGSQQRSFRRPRSQSQHMHGGHTSSSAAAAAVATSNLDLASNCGSVTTATSNQINQQKQKHKRDYENLLLLQKIQNVRPSRDIEASFGRMKLS